MLGTWMLSNSLENLVLLICGGSVFLIIFLCSFLVIYLKISSKQVKFLFLRFKGFEMFLGWQ